jgi:hypothetical protein
MKLASCSFSTPLFLPLTPYFFHITLFPSALCVVGVPYPGFLPGRTEEDNAKARLKRPIHSQLNWAILLWCYTWRKNCAVLTCNSSGLRTVSSSRFSHRELRSLVRKSHSFLSLPADTTMASYQCTQQNWQTWWGNLFVPENIQFSFSCSSFYTVQIEQMTVKHIEYIAYKLTITWRHVSACNLHHHQDCRRKTFHF